MPRHVRLIALLLTALWLPSTLHCRLESLGLDALFACADQAAETAHSDDSGCAEDGCQIIESGQFALAKTRINPALLSAPACDCGQFFLTVAPPARAPEVFASHQDETLPWQRPWQFARRAALPARAPDFTA